MYTHLKHATIATYTVLATRDEQGKKRKKNTIYYKIYRIYERQLQLWEIVMLQVTVNVALIYLQISDIKRCLFFLRNFLCQRAVSSSLLINLENE